MGTSWGAVIDYLVTGLPALLTAAQGDAELSDNVPLVAGVTGVVIGRAGTESGDAGAGTNEYAAIGRGRIQETFTVPGYIQCWRPGPTQKPARDAAISLLDVIAKFVAADPTLEKILTQGRIALTGQMSFHQTEDADDLAGEALYAGIDFELQVQNTYTP